MIEAGIVSAMVKGVWDIIKSLFPQIIEVIVKAPESFEVISTQDDIEEKILQSMDQLAVDKDDPLSDHNIPYQQRKTDTNTTSELEEFLRSNTWVLVHGAKGVGKTREAAKVIQRFRDDSWTLVVLPLDKWPHRQKFLDERVSSKKIFFFIDDLQDRPIYGPRNNSSIRLLWRWISNRYQKALIRTLKRYEKRCEPGGFMVLALTSIEGDEQRIRGADVNELERRFSPLLKQFKPYPLPSPEQRAIVKLLGKVVSDVNIKANPQDFFVIARMNKGYFKNIVSNLRRLRNTHEELNRATFKPKEIGSWSQVYASVIKRNMQSKFVYDAVDLLRVVGIMFTWSTVTETAFLLANCTHWYQWSKRRKISRAVVMLIKETDILNPAQGQIEAKAAKGEKSMEYASYIQSLFLILKALLKKQPDELFDSLLNLGHFTLEKCLFSEAIKIFKHSTELKKNSSEGWAGLGKALAGVDDIPGAFDAYDQALDLDNNKCWVWYEKGVLLLSLGRTNGDVNSTHFTEACDCLKKALDIHPHDHYILIQLGKAYGLIQERKEACENFAKAMLLQSEDTAIKTAYETVGIKLSEIKAAEDRLVKAKDPTQEEDQLHCFLVGNFLRVVKGDYQKALSYYRRATDLDSKFAHAWYGLGLAYAQIPGETDNAILSFTRAVNEDKKLQWAYYDRGKAHQSARRFDDAIADYLKAIDIDNQYFDAFYGLGNTYLEINDYSLAILNYTIALRIRQNLAYVLRARGCAKAKLNQHEDAIEDFRSAINNNQADWKAFHQRGLAYTTLNNYKDALKDYDKALCILQDQLKNESYKNRDNYNAKMSINIDRAECLFNMESYPKAIESCNSVIKSSESGYESINFDQSEKFQNDSIGGEKSNKELLKYIAPLEFILVKCYLSEAKLPEAYAHLKRALELGGKEYVSRAKEDKHLKILRENDQRNRFFELTKRFEADIHDGVGTTMSELDKSTSVIITSHHTTSTRRHVK